MNLNLLLLTAMAFADSSPIRVTEIKSFPKSYKGTAKPAGASHCTGKLKVASKHLPWIETQLAKGVDCVVADFDGNGVMDYALLRNGWTNDILGTMATDVVVLMFGPKGLEHTFALGSDLKVSEIQLVREGPDKNHPGLDGGDGIVFYFKDGQFTHPPILEENEGE